MINLKTISRNVGYALLVSALFMFLSAIVSLFNGKDSACAPLLVSFLITFIVGIFPFIFVRGTNPISLREGYIIIVLSWLLSFIFGMLPYALWGGPFTLENAWFESVSGFTTTGSTILEDIETLPKGLLFWRSSTHFIGGLGVVVFLLLVIPNSSPVKLRLTNMELSSLSKSGYSTRANKTVYIFATVYLAIAVLSFVSYLLAGMSAFDAVCHAFSVSATGGFSTRNLSIGAYDSRLIELLTMVFMFLSSLHFGLLYMAVVHHSLKPLNNPVVRFFLAALSVGILFEAFALKVTGMAPTWGTAFWNGAFQTLCVASTSGFAIADNADWPMLPNMVLLLLGVMCGCAGSTSGGVKVDRVIILFKSFGRQVAKILHPSFVNEVRIGKNVMKDEDVMPHIVYLALFFVTLGFSILVCSFAGIDSPDSFAASLSSLSNIGPAVNEWGNLGNFNSVPVLGKMVFTLDMFLGRIEIFPVLAVLAMIFDGKKR